MTNDHHPRRILVTGGAGFIGRHLVARLLADDPEARVVVLDALSYAADPGAGALADADRYRFVEGDIRDAALVAELLHEEAIDTVAHLAAETHVDRSIDGPEPFVQANLVGTATLLEAVRRVWAGRRDLRFHHASTDEVFGDRGEGPAADESSAFAPSNPYAATKAGADHLVAAWGRTFALPATITWGSNTYGPWQFPEKLVPLATTKALAGEPIPLYGDGAQTRDWIHAEDHAAAIAAVLRRGRPGRGYCVASGTGTSNRELLQRLCRELDRQAPRAAGPYERLIQAVADRPGHDRRYALDPSRIREELDWAPRCTLDEGLARTVSWFLANGGWIAAVRGRGYHGRRLGLDA